MRAVVQRVSSASVTIGTETCARIGRGFLVLLGVAEGDTEADADYLAEKIAGLRVFEDEQGRMNLSLSDVGGSLLAVSNFTLLADCRRGRRPSFSGAAAPEKAKSLYQRFVQRLRDGGVPVQTGQFQERMQVSLCNDGPVTLILESPTRDT
jgi:D-tyrosyl-tRNA(Tyr) deacylase